MLQRVSLDYIWEVPTVKLEKKSVGVGRFRSIDSGNLSP